MRDLRIHAIDCDLDEDCTCGAEPMKAKPYPLPDATGTRILVVPLTKLEENYVDEIRRRGGFTADVDLVRCALWHLAHHLDLIVQPPVFAIGQDRIEEER